MSTSTLQDDVALSDRKPAPANGTSDSARQPAPKPSLVERYKKPALIIGGIIALVFVIIYLIDAYTHEETDDAYVTGHLHEISPRVTETVTDVRVDDNQFVHKGDVLVTLDPTQYSALTLAAAANLEKAQKDLDRQQPLLATHAEAPEDVDATRSSRDVNAAEYQLAQLQVSYTTMRAPADGTIGRKNVEVGNRVAAGQTLMVVVEPNPWVVANFKETQLAYMHRGQPATVTIDAIPGKTFTGKVDSFSPATGNSFALLPADNATGNFTKIVQRVPVKILLDPDSTKGYEQRIRAGESAVVKVALTKSGQN
jgi:membrane fusion protein (multidrug efflux system)